MVVRFANDDDEVDDEVFEMVEVVVVKMAVVDDAILIVVPLEVFKATDDGDEGPLVVDGGDDVLTTIRPSPEEDLSQIVLWLSFALLLPLVPCSDCIDC